MLDFESGVFFPVAQTVNVYIEKKERCGIFHLKSDTATHLTIIVKYPSESNIYIRMNTKFKTILKQYGRL